MLITYDISLVIRPADYCGTLAVRLQTDDEPGFGVLSGRNGGFGMDHEDEQNVWMPRFPPPPEEGEEQADQDTIRAAGMYDYVIDRPGRRTRPHQVLAYSYVVTGKGNGVYYDFPDVHVLTLIERQDSWHIHFGRPHGQGFTLMLPDYEPGWLHRTR